MSESETTQVTGQATTDAGVHANAEETLLTAKPAEETTSDADAQAKTDDAKAPEKYEFVMPEGVELDEQGAADFSAIAKELNLPQDKAQKLIDLYATRMQSQAEAHKSTVQAWVNEVKADKDIGGDKLPENLATARKAVEAFGSPALKDVLTQTGLGSHPEFVKLMHRVGKAISEDRFVIGGESGAVNTDIAKSLYPNQA
jgi:hypothetical protein